MNRVLVALATIIALAVGETDPKHRLGNAIKPKSYSITITPYFDTGDGLAFSFDGAVSIIIIPQEENLKQIKLHSLDLEFGASNISVTGTGTQAINLEAANPLEFNKNYSFVYINLDSTLVKGVEYTLAISYRGPIRSDLSGFYRAYYKEDGVKKWHGATQMEPTYARKVFPCFDEPSFKATFTLSIDRPEHYSPTLSNMQLFDTMTIGNGFVREIFYPTPIMAPYLVAFLVSEMKSGKYNESKKFGIYSRPEAANQSDYAYDYGMKVVDALGEYFGIDYYSTDRYLKLDHVGLPDFNAGAMENWGLVKYREGSLMYDANESPPTSKLRIASIIAHETTHMWFGNLVTCHWWSDTWLNEAFANYFQDYITSIIAPELYSIEDRVTSSTYRAYTADEAEKANPISNPDVNSPEEIKGHFGTITYEKGGSILRMIHHLLGNDAFQKGLNTYLNAYKFENGYPEYMYAALNDSANAVGAMNEYEGISIADVMRAWITQAGHPILEVSVKDSVVTLKQRRFYQNSSLSSNLLYPIPLTYSVQGKPIFNNTKPVRIMNTQNMTLNMTGELNAHQWILFNLQETGFYRVNYDKHTWQLIASALRGDQRTSIHNLNRAKIINDLFAFLRADVVDFDILHGVIGFLIDEEDYSVWSAAIEGFNNLRNIFHGTELKKEIDELTLELMQNIIIKLALNAEEPTETYKEVKNRMQIFSHACKIGHELCIARTVAAFQDFKNNNVRVTPSLRSVVYCNGLRHGTAEDFEFLWNEMLKSNVANDVSVIMAALACTKDESKLRKYLLAPIQEDRVIRLQDANYPWNYVLSDHDNVDIAIDVFKTNFTQYSKTYTSLTKVINAITGALHTNEQFNAFQSWLSSCDTCDSDLKESTKTSLETARSNARWATKNLNVIQKQLRGACSILVPSIVTIIIMLVIAIFIRA